jgi:hypothetical protein
MSKVINLEVHQHSKKVNGYGGHDFHKHIIDGWAQTTHPWCVYRSVMKVDAQLSGSLLQQNDVFFLGTLYSNTYDD